MIKLAIGVFAIWISLAMTYRVEPNAGIDACYLEFTGSKGLTAQEPDRLPRDAAVPQQRVTSEGNHLVTLVDGYRILYNNKKGVPFVNLKVEQSEAGSYEADQAILIMNLDYMADNPAGAMSDKVVELTINGYKLYGLSRNTIESGSIMSTFLMFPGDDTVVYFYFNNLKPAYRNFDSVKDFEKQRDRFFLEYTELLSECLN